MNDELVLTTDRSHTLKSPRYGVTFHSIHGAISESSHVFVDAGLRHVMEQYAPDRVNILEVGLGTGLNAILTYLATRSEGPAVHYVGLEPHPPEKAILGKLNHGEVLGFSDYRKLIDLFYSNFNRKVEVADSRFQLLGLNEKVQNHTSEEDKTYDLVYYDAFAPGAQPEMWSLETLDILSKSLSPHAVLVTYCAQGQFKRNLRELGFKVESLAGPPGKREMVRATYR